MMRVNIAIALHYAGGDPPGEFLSARQLYERYNSMGTAEFAKTNAELARNYIRNFQQVRGLVPYVVGRYVIMEARELSSSDIFTSGMVALSDSVENPELMLEHLYPAEPRTVVRIDRFAIPPEKAAITVSLGPRPPGFEGHHR